MHFMKFISYSVIVKTVQASHDIDRESLSLNFFMFFEFLIVLLVFYFSQKKSHTYMKSNKDPVEFLMIKLTFSLKQWKNWHVGHPVLYLDFLCYCIHTGEPSWFVNCKTRFHAFTSNFSIMVSFNLTKIALTLFGLYILNSLYVLYHFFNVPECKGGSGKCLHPRSTGQQLEVSLGQNNSLLSYCCKFC